MEIGSNYFIRTDTDHWLGRLVSVDGPYTVTLEDFAWVASAGRLNEFLNKGTANEMEIEHAPDGMRITLNWRACITWPHDLIRRTV
jgi:hypothetical protein